MADIPIGFTSWLKTYLSLLGTAWRYARSERTTYIFVYTLFAFSNLIMEQKLAFNLGRNFLHERYHQALHLSVKWHQDHHSGATINRIRKAHDALRGFEAFPEERSCRQRMEMVRCRHPVYTHLHRCRAWLRTPALDSGKVFYMGGLALQRRH